MADTDTPCTANVSEGRGLRAAPTILGLVLAIAVVLPLTTGGWPLLLDYVPGPHQAIPDADWGLGNGVTAALPYFITVFLLGKVVGAPVAAWAILAAFFPLATCSISRLVKGPLRATLSAGLLYAVNPVVFERFDAGQIAYLLGYALLPNLLVSLNAPSGDTRRGKNRPPIIGPVLWLTILTGCSVHFLWIGMVLIAAKLISNRISIRRLTWLFAVMVLVGLANAYLIPSSQSSPEGTHVTNRDLGAYATKAEPNLGTVGTVATLYGFWRVEPPLPKAANPGWPFFFMAIILISLAGLGHAYRDGDVDEREKAKTIFLAGIVGLLVACGQNGPLGPVFTWMFVHVPGFAVMREPQKFVALVALLYAYGFGKGLVVLCRQISAPRVRTAASLCTFLLPVIYTPTVFWGLAGRLHSSQYPASWYSARSALPADSRILFLPWHQYLSFPFTDNRIIANPAASFFTQDVISGDNVELPTLPSTSTSPRSDYLEQLMARGNDLHDFGALTAPLGVDYVAVSHTVDWQKYAWLAHQEDLSQIITTNDLTIYRNTQSHGKGYVVSTVRETKSLADFLANSLYEDPSPDTFVIGDQPSTDLQPPSQVLSPNVVTKRSPITYKVAPTRPGSLLFTQEYHSSWHLGSTPGRQTVSGSIVYPTSGSANYLRFTAWQSLMLAYLVSIITVAFLVLKRSLFSLAKGRSKTKLLDEAQTRGQNAGEVCHQQ